LSARALKQDGDTGATSSPRARALVIEGREGRGGAAGGEDDQLPIASGSEGFELNFENTPVTTVAKVILGDILGLGYTIDPRVQGTISLASGRPVPKSEMLYALESVLRINNVVLIRDTTGYRLVPAGEAVGGGNLDRSADASEPGYGITVVPLRHVSSQTLIKLLDSFATKPNTVRADPGRNVLVVQGTSPERRATVEIVLSFDNDWMRGQSVGIYPVRNSTPEQMVQRKRQRRQMMQNFQPPGQGAQPLR
jgi:general secretion pathway protein D